MADSEGRVLVLLLDTSIGMWEQLRRNDLQKSSAGPSHLNQASFISQFLQFLNTYLMMQEGNKATVFAVDGSGSHLLYSPPVSSSQSKSKQHATQSAADEVLHILLQHLQASSPAGQATLPCWSAALSRALCLIHKQQQATVSTRSEGPKPRILCISGSPDVPAQYIASMNAIFSAQREGVVIDTCMVGHQDSAFLQQAAHITEGLYLRPKHTGALLQYLLVSTSELLASVTRTVLMSIAAVLSLTENMSMASSNNASWGISLSDHEVERVFNMWYFFHHFCSSYSGSTHYISYFYA